MPFRPTLALLVVAPVAVLPAPPPARLTRQRRSCFLAA